MPVVDIYATWRVVYSQRQRAIVKNRYFSKFKFQNFVHVERSDFQWEVRLRYFCWAKATSAQLMCTITAPEKTNFHVWCCAGHNTNLRSPPYNAAVIVQIKFYWVLWPPQKYRQWVQSGIPPPIACTHLWPGTQFTLPLAPNVCFFLTFSEVETYLFLIKKTLRSSYAKSWLMLRDCTRKHCALEERRSVRHREDGTAGSFSPAWFQ